MKLKFYRSIRFENDWEFTVMLGNYQLRVGRSQIAFWRNYEPIFNWISSKVKSS